MSQDVFGNLITTAIFGVATEELTITSELTVEQSAVAWPVFQIDPAAHGYPFSYSSDDRLDMGALAAETSGEETVRAWADAFVATSPTDTLDLLKAINTRIVQQVIYRTRDEEGTQSAGETLAKGSGSCRDIAELFIQSVRHLGFGARAVSGYLFDPDGASDDDGSTHAWAEVYLPAAGWIAFDPTHSRVGQANLIPVAVARSNKQIMPVVGAYGGAADDFIEMTVQVSVTLDPETAIPLLTCNS